MAVPDFQSLMLPLLQFASDEQEHTQVEAREILANQLSMNEADLAERTSGGGQPKFANRIAWAKVHLQGAGLLETVRRGVFRITPRGREVLGRKPSSLVLRDLSEFAEYRSFRNMGEQQDKNTSTQTNVEPNDLTPFEVLEQAHAVMHQSLVGELQALVKANSPSFFEQLVIQLLVRMGYGGSQQEAARAVGKSGDEGIDGIIDEDRLGLEVIYVQAKRWKEAVQRPELQKFVGALQGKRAKKGVFITTSDFTNGAREYVRNIDNKVVLIDGQRLAELMIEFGVGVTTISSYAIKRIDLDFFEG
jgi:restriction system protein